MKLTRQVWFSLLSRFTSCLKSSRMISLERCVGRSVLTATYREQWADDTVGTARIQHERTRRPSIINAQEKCYHTQGHKQKLGPWLRRPPSSQTEGDKEQRQSSAWVLRPRVLTRPLRGSSIPFICKRVPQRIRFSADTLVACVLSKRLVLLIPHSSTHLLRRPFLPFKQADCSE